MEGLSVIGYVFRMMGIVALVRVEKLIKTLNLLFFHILKHCLVNY